MHDLNEFRSCRTACFFIAALLEVLINFQVEFIGSDAQTLRHDLTKYNAFAIFFVPNLSCPVGTSSRLGLRPGLGCVPSWSSSWAMFGAGLDIGAV